MDEPDWSAVAVKLERLEGRLGQLGSCRGLATEGINKEGNSMR